MPEKSPGGRTRPIPSPYKHISANGCKTPGCENFGIPPREGLVLKGRGRAAVGDQGDDYVVTNTGSTDLRCKKCNKFSRLKSNKAIHEELERQGAYLWVESPLKCPDETCANHKPSGPV